MDSKHLDEIMAKHNRIASLQVVFVDIEKYSQRRTITQTEVIDRFTDCLGRALTKTSKEYTEYSQANGINFQSDIITLPTGDGAAIAFSFDGLHDIHLRFTKFLLETIHESNSQTPCEKFNGQHWCNCHANFGIRTGISEGKGIVYRDINSNYNVAGNVINLASRVMGLADAGQVIFTEDAYRQIIDMVDDPNLIDRFIEYNDLPFKHSLKLNAFQYKGEGEAYLDSNPPSSLALIQSAQRAFSKMGLPRFADAVSPGQMENMFNALENLGNVMGALQDEAKPVIDIKTLHERIMDEEDQKL